jgi:hypothetical protein
MKYFIFIYSVIGLKYSKIFRPGVNLDLVESLVDIKLYKDPSFTYLG